METFDVRLFDLHDGRDESTDLHNDGFIEEVFSRRARSHIEEQKTRLWASSFRFGSLLRLSVYKTR